MYLNHYQTMKLSFEQICQGQSPWIPLGNFMNDWYAYHIDERERLICDALPQDYPSSFHYWAVFCAASVEWFANTYEIRCPDWVFSSQYHLSAPHFSSEHETLKTCYLAKTPEEFTRRNIFCGNRMYTNKYELDERRRPLREHPVDLGQRRMLVQAAAARAQQEEAELNRLLQEDIELQAIIARRNAQKNKNQMDHIDA